MEGTGSSGPAGDAVGVGDVGGPAGDRACFACASGKYKSELGSANCVDCPIGSTCACPHGRKRSQCKLCGGGGLCQHGNQKSRCLPCCTGLCPLHPTVLKINCKVCTKCIHNKRKQQCKMCTKKGRQVISSQKVMGQAQAFASTRGSSAVSCGCPGTSGAPCEMHY